MSADEQLDPRENTNHPRHQLDLVGHDKAEQELLTAYRSGKFHHAWMICGPKGIGKATLAYRLARFILAHPDLQSKDVQEAKSLFVAGDNPVTHRINARGHSDLLVVQRELNPKTKKLRANIMVDDARKTNGFFSKTAGEGGWRICIIDAAEELNITSANSILKILEEPPNKAMFIVVSNSPGRLLPTIRSRCLRLDLSALQNEQVETVLASREFDKKPSAEELASVIELSAGSPGRSLQLLSSGGAMQFVRFKNLAERSSSMDLGKLMAIAETFSRPGTETEFNIFADLLSNWLGARALVAGQQSQKYHANAFAGLHSQFSDSIARTNALNLDRRQTLMMAFDDIEKILISA